MFKNVISYKEYAVKLYVTLVIWYCKSLLFHGVNIWPYFEKKPIAILNFNTARKSTVELKYVLTHFWKLMIVFIIG